MRLLISNDDGYRAPGITALAQRLQQQAEVTVVAPELDRSGASNSLTLDQPLRVRQADNGFYHVNGTPTDCVHLAITGLLDFEPDMVLSGINAGANMGDDVLYSGTVAAAMEGRFLGLPAIAISLCGVEGSSVHHFDTAAEVAVRLLERLSDHPIPNKTILNVNVPNMPWEQLGGFAVTRQGSRHRSAPVIKEQDPRGRPIYWVGPCGEVVDAGPGTDFYAVSNNQISVTPLQVDLTRHQSLDDLGEWLKGDEDVS